MKFTRKHFFQAIICLTLATGLVITAIAPAAAADGPLPPYTVVVEIVEDGIRTAPGADGDEDEEASPQLIDFTDLLANGLVDLVVQISSKGVFAYAADWGSSSGDAHPQHQQDGHTATGLREAAQSCGGYLNCHVILVNYALPSEADQAAAQLAAEEMEQAGIKLHSVATGINTAEQRHFNWELSGQGFAGGMDEALGIIESISSNIAPANADGTPNLPRNWDDLTSQEKIWLNPMGCDLETQWLRADTGQCDDKSAPFIITVQVAEDDRKDSDSLELTGGIAELVKDRFVDIAVEVDSQSMKSFGIGWKVDFSGIEDDLAENGAVATGLAEANRRCGVLPNCHVVLVTHQRPENRQARIAAKKAAEALAEAGHKLHAVAAGINDVHHLGFNWYLSGQAFSGDAFDGLETIRMISDNVAPDDNGLPVLPHNWDELTSLEKIWLNPMGCDLETQWLQAYDGSCTPRKRTGERA